MNIAQSENIAELAAALATAQGKLEFAVKDSQNPHFKNTYASLSSVLDAIRPVFSECGLSVSQDPVSEGDMVGVATTLMHKSGQWKRGVLMCKPGKSGPQEIGSIITYFRRYGLSAVAGITQDDEDGETAHGRPTQQQVNPRPAGLGQVMVGMLKERGFTAAKAIALYNELLGKDKPGSEADYQKIIAHLSGDFFEQAKAEDGGA